MSSWCPIAFSIVLHASLLSLLIGAKVLINGDINETSVLSDTKRTIQTIDSLEKTDDCNALVLAGMYKKVHCSDF